MLTRRDRPQGAARRHRGQAMIEMAIVMTFLLMLVFGICDFGLFMFKYVEAANCTREAARRAVVYDPNATSPTYCVGDLKPTLSHDPSTLKRGDEITARIDATYDWMALKYIIPELPSPMPFTSETSMRMEGKL